MWREEARCERLGKGGDSRFSSCVDQGWPEPAWHAMALAVSGPGRERGVGAGSRVMVPRQNKTVERKQLWIRVENRKKGRVQAESSLYICCSLCLGNSFQRGLCAHSGSVRPRASWASALAQWAITNARPVSSAG